MLVAVVVLSVLVVILTYIVYNLTKKQEKIEDIVVGYLEYFDKISRVIEISDKKLKEIDYKGHFSSDDEVGYFFENIKQIQDILNEFNLKQLK